LNSHLHKLLRIAQALNLAVVVTNQVQANPQAFFAILCVLLVGTLWPRIHAPDYAEKVQSGITGSEGDRLAYLPESETYFHITKRALRTLFPETNATNKGLTIMSRPWGLDTPLNLYSQRYGS